MLYYCGLAQETCTVLSSPLLPGKALNAYSGLSSENTWYTQQNVKIIKFQGSGGQRDIMRCFRCNSRDQRAVDCPSRASTHEIN